MIYEKECTNCGRIKIIACSISDHEQIVKPDSRCVECGGREIQILHPSLEVRVRTPFPKGWQEHVAPTPKYIRDRSEAKDVLAENGLGSKFIDDGG